MAQHRRGEDAPRRTSRRVFLGWIGVGGAAAAVGGCQGSGRRGALDTAPHEHELPAVTDGPGLPHANRDALQFFNPHQAATVDAFTARIIPGTDDDPGASQAGVVFYIDHLLATHSGHPDPAYMQGPFAQTYGEGEEPPEGDDGIWVQEEELERYGRQSPFVPRQVYRMGVARLDVLCDERFGSQFVDLDPDEQDGVIEALEDEDDDVAEIFDEVSANEFFETVRTHTVQGFLSDPVYGGNRDMVGWRHVGFPGSRRSYSPADFFDEDYDVTPQSLLDLPAFNADHHPSHSGGVPALRQRHPRGPVD